VDGNVSSIVESGHLYLQLNIDIVTSLEEILPNDEFLDQDYFLKSKEDIRKDKVYITKYEADNIWSRVQVLDIINDSEVSTIMIKIYLRRPYTDICDICCLRLTST